MKALEENLLDIPLEEKKEALSFYENYFDDAGPEREQTIISELGPPSQVAASIKANLINSDQELSSRGYFTEKGYENESYKQKYEIIGGMSPVNYDNLNSRERVNEFASDESSSGNSSNYTHTEYNKSTNNERKKEYYNRRGMSWFGRKMMQLIVLQ